MKGAGLKQATEYRELFMVLKKPMNFYPLSVGIQPPPRVELTYDFFFAFIFLQKRLAPTHLIIGIQEQRSTSPLNQHPCQKQGSGHAWM
jgi:hypothetical protein